MEESKRVGYQRPLDLLCPYLITGQEISRAKEYLQRLNAVSGTPETEAALTVADAVLRVVTQLHIATTDTDGSEGQAVLRVMVPFDLLDEMIERSQEAFCVHAAPETLSVEALAARKLLTLVNRAWKWEIYEHDAAGAGPGGLDEEAAALLYQDIPHQWVEEYMLYVLGQYSGYGASGLAWLTAEHFGVVVGDREAPAVRKAPAIFVGIAEDVIAFTATLWKKGGANE